MLKIRPKIYNPASPTVLITGGCGFIGSHLCDFLIARGFCVICIDNLITSRKENIAHLLKNPKFEFVEHDVTRYIDIKGDLDYVLHLASLASPMDYQNYPIKTLKVGSLGTHNTLGLAKAKAVKYLLASTSEVYGNPEVNPQPEDYWGNVNPIGKRSMYDESKRFSEAITMAYHKAHQIDTKIVRIFNTYGERMRKDDGRAVPTFINQALNDKPITIFGDGSQTRSFCYISDMLGGIYRLMLSDINEPVNLGNPNEITISRLAEVIIKLTGSKSKLTYKPLPEDDPKVRRPDITKAKGQLAWQPEIGLEEGLEKTIAWFRTNN